MLSGRTLYFGGRQIAHSGCGQGGLALSSGHGLRAPGPLRAGFQNHFTIFTRRQIGRTHRRADKVRARLVSLTCLVVELLQNRPATELSIIAMNWRVLPSSGSLD